jgi:hypothetical protein
MSFSVSTIESVMVHSLTESVQTAKRTASDITRRIMLNMLNVEKKTKTNRPELEGYRAEVHHGHKI